MAFRTEITVASTLYAEECCVCGIYFAMPEELYNSRRRDGRSFYCPNGHAQSYTENDATRLAKMRAQLAEKEASIQQMQGWVDKAIAQRDLKHKELLQERKQKVALEKRISNGVCPCCHRSFVGLTRHMRSKHPDYVEDAAK
jgi:hypothetical protein